MRSDRIIADIESGAGRALICLVGVQSNQFPRAVDIAGPFLAAGLPVILGGFHVSGCISMLDEHPPEIEGAIESGISVFAGELEGGRFDRVLRDAWNHELEPIYDYVNDLPVLGGEPTPFLSMESVSRTLSRRASFDLGRGCPFQCSFCTIINVQGRTSRFRSVEDLEKIVRQNAAEGIFNFFITDDDFARNRLWESFFDKLIELREKDKLPVRFIIQVDTQCHKIPNFIQKARRAGCRRVFVGLESVNADNLRSAKKHQNEIAEYRKMLMQWREAGVLFVWAGYITGFPGDTKESILRDIETIKRELPIDMLELFMMTPLPGSEYHRDMLRDGQWMDADLNKYDNYHRVSHHPKMSDREWEEAHHEAWRACYSWSHVKTIARRHAATGGRPRGIAKRVTQWKAMYDIERVHPLEGGLLRLKYRGDRRAGLPREPLGWFHLKLLAGQARKIAMYAWYTVRSHQIGWSVHLDASARHYRDAAINPEIPEARSPGVSSPFRQERTTDATQPTARAV